MDLFDDLPLEPDAATTIIAPGSVLLRGLALDGATEQLQAVETVLQQAPLRHMQTPGGYTMSVATSSCGALGWVSDQHGYRYAMHDPQGTQAVAQYSIGADTLLLGAATLEINVCPMEGFAVKVLDEELGLDARGLTSVVIASLGYHSSEDFNATLPKSRLPVEKVLTHI